MKTLCIYCASSDGVEDIYQETAKRTGQYCAQNGIKIVYGGGHVGLMGLVADSALENDGQVTGVIPEFLKEREVGHTGLSEMITTGTMQERQAKMAELSDAFLVLPGGLGTLAEFFEILTWRQLNLHDKPIYVWDVNGYWSSLIETVKIAEKQGFLKQDPQSLFQVITTIDEVGFS